MSSVIQRLRELKDLAKGKGDHTIEAIEFDNAIRDASRELLAVAEAAEKFVNSNAFQGVCDEECDIESALTELNEVQL